jgi:hypothetical protein
MAQIGNLVANSSSVFNLDFLPERLLIGEAQDNQNINNISVVTSGVQLMSITSQPRINALARFDQGITSVLFNGEPQPKVPSYLKLALGRINKQTTINLNNGAPNTSGVFAASSGMSNIARRAVEQSINPSANATFDNFEALIYSSVDTIRVTLQFENGYVDEYAPNEIDALFSSFNTSDLNNKLDGLSVINSDTPNGTIVMATIYNGSGGATVVLKSDYVEL